MASSPNEPAPPPLLGAHCCLSVGDGRLAFKAEDGADAGEGSSSLPGGRLRSPLSPLSKSLQTITCLWSISLQLPTPPTPACLKDQISGFFVLIPTGHHPRPSSPPCSTPSSAIARAPRAPLLPLASPTLPEPKSHLLDRTVSVFE